MIKTIKLVDLLNNRNQVQEDLRSLYEDIDLYEDKIPAPLFHAYKSAQLDTSGRGDKYTGNFKGQNKATPQGGAATDNLNSIENDAYGRRQTTIDYHSDLKQVKDNGRYSSARDYGNASYDKISKEECLNWLGLKVVEKVGTRWEEVSNSDAIRNPLPAKNKVDVLDPQGTAKSKINQIRLVYKGNESKNDYRLTEYDYLPSTEEYYPVIREEIPEENFGKYSVDQNEWMAPERNRADLAPGCTNKKSPRSFLYALKCADFVFKTNDNTADIANITIATDPEFTKLAFSSDNPEDQELINDGQLEIITREGSYPLRINKISPVVLDISFALKGDVSKLILDYLNLLSKYCDDSNPDNILFQDYWDNPNTKAIIRKAFGSTGSWADRAISSILQHCAQLINLRNNLNKWDLSHFFEIEDNHLKVININDFKICLIIGSICMQDFIKGSLKITEPKFGLDDKTINSNTELYSGLVALSSLTQYLIKKCNYKVLMASTAKDLMDMIPTEDRKSQLQKRRYLNFLIQNISANTDRKPASVRVANDTFNPADSNPTNADTYLSSHSDKNEIEFTDFGKHSSVLSTLHSYKKGLIKAQKYYLNIKRHPEYYESDEEYDEELAKAKKEYQDALTKYTNKMNNIKPKIIRVINSEAKEYLNKLVTIDQKAAVTQLIVTTVNDLMQVLTSLGNMSKDDILNAFSSEGIDALKRLQDILRNAIQKHTAVQQKLAEFNRRKQDLEQQLAQLQEEINAENVNLESAAIQMEQAQKEVDSYSVGVDEALVAWNKAKQPILQTVDALKGAKVKPELKPEIQKVIKFTDDLNLTAAQQELVDDAEEELNDVMVDPEDNE